MSNKKKVAFDGEKENGTMQVGLIEGNGRKRLPDEVWMQIFEMARESRKLSKLRLVCKHWQRIIDENVYLKVRINEGQMDVSSIFKFKGVVQCRVYAFVRLPRPRNLLFRDPYLLSSLSLCGTITNQNFLTIVKECKNVKELLLVGSLITEDSTFFKVWSGQDKKIVSDFMSRLQNLRVNGLCIGSSKIRPMPLRLHNLLDWPMHKLKVLVIRAIFENGARVENYFHLLENFHSLEKLEFFQRSDQVPLQLGPKLFSLPFLSTLNVMVRAAERVPDWLPFIRNQSSIKHLILVTSSGEYDLDQNVLDSISNNANCLESLELGTLGDVDSRAIGQFFKKSRNLKSLVLRGKRQRDLENLEFLTSSLEMLSLQSFRITQRELLLLQNRGIDLKIINIVLRA